jgi:hypothetical protein
MTTDNARYSPEDIEFFVLVQELMHTHPDKDLVNRAHQLARRSPLARDAYFDGAWLFIDRVKNG